MNILGIGAPELILIFMIAIIVAGPKRMLHWAFIAGQYIGKLRAMWGDVAKVIQAEVDAAGLDVQVPKDIPTRADVGRMIQQAAKPIAEPIKKVSQEVDRDYQRVQADMKASIKTPSLEDIQKEKDAPKPPAQTPVTSVTPDLGSWGSGTSPAKSANGVKPATPDLGTWGASGSADTADPS